MAAAVLAADAPLVYRGVDLGERKIIAAVTDIFYQGALIYWSAAAGGLTPVAAASTVFFGIHLDPAVSATAATTYIRCATKGEFKLTGLDTTIANEEDAQGYTFVSDVTDASDNPADLLAIASGTTGDIVVGTCTEWLTSASIWLDIGQRYGAAAGSGVIA